MGAVMDAMRQRLGHNQPEREAIIRSAPRQNAALCDGIPPWVAQMVGVKSVPPQPHRWYPVGRRGQLCLRCSRYEAGP
jgi:hypothetical protein